MGFGAKNPGKLPRQTPATILELPRQTPASYPGKPRQATPASPGKLPRQPIPAIQAPETRSEVRMSTRSRLHDHVVECIEARTSCRHTDRDLAAILDCSERTVRGHLKELQKTHGLRVEGRGRRGRELFLLNVKPFDLIETLSSFVKLVEKLASENGGCFLGSSGVSRELKRPKDHIKEVFSFGRRAGYLAQKPKTVVLNGIEKSRVCWVVTHKFYFERSLPLPSFFEEEKNQEETIEVLRQDLADMRARYDSLLAETVCLREQVGEVAEERQEVKPISPIVPTEFPTLPPPTNKDYMYPPGVKVWEDGRGEPICDVFELDYFQLVAMAEFPPYGVSGAIFGSQSYREMKGNWEDLRLSRMSKVSKQFETDRFMADQYIKFLNDEPESYTPDTTSREIINLLHKRRRAEEEEICRRLEEAEAQAAM